MSSPQQASTMAAVIESWPQPAHSVDMRAFVVAPREPERVASAARGGRPSALMNVMDVLSSACASPAALRLSRGASARVARARRRRWARRTSASRCSAGASAASPSRPRSRASAASAAARRGSARPRTSSRAAQEALDVLAEGKGAHAHVVDARSPARRARRSPRARRRRSCRRETMPISLSPVRVDHGLAARAARRSRTCASAGRARPGTRPSPRCKRRTACAPSRA